MEKYSKILGAIPILIVVAIQLFISMRKKTEAQRKVAERKQELAEMEAQGIEPEPSPASLGHWETAKTPAKTPVKTAATQPVAKPVTQPKTTVPSPTASSKAPPKTATTAALTSSKAPSVTKKADPVKKAKPKKSEPASRGHWEIDDDGKFKFPKPQEKSSAYKPLQDINTQQATLQATSFSTPAELQATLQAAQPALPQAAALPKEIPGREAAAKDSQQMISTPLTQTVKSNFPECLDYLPPLKRAVALGEILGSPKGLI